MLSQVYQVWDTLRDIMPKWLEQFAHGASAQTDAELGVGVADTFRGRFSTHVTPYHVAAYLLDPIMAVTVPSSPGTWCLPFHVISTAFPQQQEQGSGVTEVQVDMLAAALDVVLRVGNIKAPGEVSACKREWARLELDLGLPGSICGSLPGLTRRDRNNQGRLDIASAHMRKGWWGRYATAEFPHVAKAAVRLLSAHATTAAAERNWSAWGRVYSKSRSALKVKTAEKVIKNNWAKKAPQQQFEVCMDFVGVDSGTEE